MGEQKLRTRVEDLRPSDWFRGKYQAWQQDLQTWHVTQMEFRDPNKKAVVSSSSKIGERKEDNEGLKPPKRAKTEKDNEPGEGKDGERTDAKDFDLFGIENICDFGTGEPLFANFEFEDWV